MAAPDIDGLVERLRAGGLSFSDDQLMKEAASALEEVRRDRDALKEALLELYNEDGNAIRGMMLARSALSPPLQEEG